MCHANTDVTIVSGSSIPESMYVCSYTVKADKNPMIIRDTIRKLRNLDNGIDDRKLLGSVARSSCSVRVVGAQEAVDFLLNNPLTFCSAEVTNVNTYFLLIHPGALTPTEISNYGVSAQESFNVKNILPTLDCDENAAVSSSANKRGKRGKATVHHFLRRYMRRPVSLEPLSASSFHALYVIRPLHTTRVHYDKSMLLLPGSQDTSEERKCKGGSQRMFIVDKRMRASNQPPVTNILNVPSRGIADDDSPYFAAAALSLHVPFRTPSDLLCGQTLTKRLKDLLSCSTYPALNEYVLRCHDLSAAISNPPPSTEQNNNNPIDESNTVSGDNAVNDSELETDDTVNQPNPLADLPPLIAAEGTADPLSVSKQWTGTSCFGTSNALQLERYKSYLNDCKVYGLKVAERNQLHQKNEEMEDNFASSSQDFNVFPDLEATVPGNTLDPTEAHDILRNIISTARNDEQKCWLESVFSYLLVYYNPFSESVPTSLKNLCQQNHPIFTNAPGGCGKSWLLQRVDEFIARCIPYNATPVWSQEPGSFGSQEPGSFQRTADDDFIVSVDEFLPGRLGRVAVFALSGVAAGNANGFTFHNGLRFHMISEDDIQDGPSPEVLAKLMKDFARVVLLVIDEYSMAALQFFAYLDRVARKVRPSFAHIPFGGIPLLITGDGLQLPVFNAKGLLSNPNSIPTYLQDVYDHCTNGLFFLKLNMSVRQEGDIKFGEVLRRIRLAVATEEDALLLNTRYVSDLRALCRESPEWLTAPILTAKNTTVDALNNAAIKRNGSQLGTLHVHSMPMTTKAKSVTSKRKIAKDYFRRKNPLSTVRDGNRFIPPVTTVLYPRMPVMLRTNICPSLGLYNGSIGQIHFVLAAHDGLPPHEPRSDATERCAASPFTTPHIPSLLVSFPNTYRGSVSAISPTGNQSPARIFRSVVLIEPQRFDRVCGLPLVPAHAMSMHKSQSLTLPNAIIDPRNLFCMGAIYVALSRAPGLNKIALIAPVSKQILNKFYRQTNATIALIAEMEKNANAIDPFLSFVRKSKVSLFF